MKKILGILMVGLMLLFAPTIAGAVDSTITYTDKAVGGNVRVLTFTCTAKSTDGSYLSTVSNDRDLEGFVFLVITNPGTTGPTDDTVDAVLNDADGVDIMGGQLTDLDETDSEQFVPLINNVFGSRFVKGTLTPVITNNAVHSAVIVISIYYYK